MKLKYLLIALIIFCTQMFVFHSTRLLSTPTLPDYDQYVHIAEIKQIKSYGFDFQDNVYLVNIVLTFTKNFIFFMRLIPFAVGLLNIILVYLIINKLIKCEKQKFVSILILILSPNFIYIHGIYNDQVLALFFTLLGVLLLLKDRYLTSGVVFLISFILNLRYFLIIILILLIFYDKLKSKNSFIPLSGIIAVTCVFISINKSAFPQSMNFHSLLTYYISDLGAIQGIGIFSFIIGLLGIIMSWEHKKENSIYYYCLIALFISSLTDNSLMFFLNIILSYYGGFALTKISSIKWQSKVLKKYVVLLIMCGIIFSSGAYINRFSEIGPSYSEILSLKSLPSKDGGVFSHYSYGYLIKSMSGLSSFTDKRYYQYSKDKIRINLSNQIFGSRDFKEITDFLNKYNLKYIWINEKMKQGQVWKHKDDGMLLILQNSANFQKMYNYQGVEIWHYMS